VEDAPAGDRVGSAPDDRAHRPEAHRVLGELRHVARGRDVPRGVEAVRPREPRPGEPELARLRVHHRHETGRRAVADVLGEGVRGVVRALDQGGLHQVPHRDPLAGPQVDRRLTDVGGLRADAHHVVEIRVLEGDDHGHELGDARDRNPRPARVLREYLAGGGVLDDERPRRHRRPACMGRSRSGEDESCRREGAGAHQHGRQG
jgi:hypothetical protein